MSDLPANAGSLIGERLGKYEVLALLALGGTGEIYLARIGGAHGFEKYVVVKCLHDHLADDAEFVHMFLDEARLGAQLDHSNIVQTLELGEHRGRYYMVMEYLAGMSLAAIAKKADERLPTRRLPVDLVLGLAAQACAGLHYTHERSAPSGMPLEMVHRDISPQNLVVSFEGVLKLVDFGVAKAALRDTHTQSGTIKGKFAYMSPEQCLARDVDRRTDIFALGVIVWELLTGQRLFKRASSYDTYQAIVKGEVELPSAVDPQLDPAIDRVVMKALAYEREERYPTAEAFGEALIILLHQRGEHVSSGDVARFFERHFAQEIDEHAARMRELIEGRPSTLDDMTWDVDPDSDAALQMPDDIPELVDHEPGAEQDEDEAEATRVELDPMAHFQELDAPDPSGDATALSDRLSDASPARKPAPPQPRPDSAPLGKRGGSAPPVPSLRPDTAPTSETIPARPSTNRPTRPIRAPSPLLDDDPTSLSPGPGRPPTSTEPSPPPARPVVPSDSHPFPQVQTPSGLRSPAERADERPRPPGAGNDLALRHAERGDASRSPLLLAIVFLVATGVGIGATLLIGSLVG